MMPVTHIDVILVCGDARGNVRSHIDDSVHNYLSLISDLNIFPLRLPGVKNNNLVWLFFYVNKRLLVYVKYSLIQ